MKRKPEPVELARGAALPHSEESATEEPLIEESVWGAVRALRERGLSKREIGRELDLDIKAVRKWLRQKWEPQRRPGRSRELDR